MADDEEPMEVAEEPKEEAEADGGALRNSLRIRAAFRAASTAQFSLRTCNTHAGPPPPAEEPEYEIEEILKKRKRKNKEYDPEAEGSDAEPEYIEEYYVKWKGWDGPKDNTWEPLAHVEDLSLIHISEPTRPY